MEIKRVFAVYFSPCGNVRKIVTHLAAVVAGELGCECREVDFTLPQARKAPYEFSKGDLVVFGTPVFAGRIPNKLLPFVQDGFKGGGAPAIAICSYGNRSFDNALAEIAGELDDNGFTVVGAAAVPSQHSFSERLAAGRPDAEDMDAISGFGRKMAVKIIAAPSGAALKAPDAGQSDTGCADAGQSDTGQSDAGQSDIKQLAVTSLNIPGEYPAPGYYTPLKRDGTPAKFLKATPLTDDKCVNCGLCARSCPMGSIDPADNRTMTGVCIKCHACVNKCPKGAKFFDNEELASHIDMLVDNYSQLRREILFLKS